MLKEGDLVRYTNEYLRIFARMNFGKKKGRYRFRAKQRIARIVAIRRKPEVVFKKGKAYVSPALVELDIQENGRAVLIDSRFLRFHSRTFNPPVPF